MIFYLLLIFTSCSAQAQHEHHHGHQQMQGFYGNYPMTKEASGTAWVPESSVMDGYHVISGDWMMMFHGYANYVFDHQGGIRGDRKNFSESMFMGMATHELGSGRFGVRSMLSLDPLMGPQGYPLLLQTGETADGVDHLIDRQHPHDLLMEIAATYTQPFADLGSVYIYAGYPGEPALGPPTFMHRFSGMINPEAPITHHWLDSTHVTFGVATVGIIWDKIKMEGSIFTGREPDQHRWNFEEPKLDSFSWRIGFNPSQNWSFQVSQGYLHSPEQLDPTVDQRRSTVSATYNMVRDEDAWQTTAAWGRNNNQPGNVLDAWLVESAIRVRSEHNFFARFERVEKDELFLDTDPRAGNIFNVSKISIGYDYDLKLVGNFRLGMGAMGSAFFLPSTLDGVYGSNPYSFMLFGRAAL